MNLKRDDSQPSAEERLKAKFYPPAKWSKEETSFSYEDNFDSVFDETSPEKTKPK